RNPDRAHRRADRPLLSRGRARAAGAAADRRKNASLIPDSLVAAYKAAHYVVFGEPDIILKVDEPNAHLDALLDAKRAACAAFISAANPRGEPRGLVRNVIAFQALKILVRKSRYLCFEGEGRDPAGVW